LGLENEETFWGSNLYPNRSDKTKSRLNMWQKIKQTEERRYNTILTHNTKHCENKSTIKIPIINKHQNK